MQSYKLAQFGDTKQIYNLRLQTEQDWRVFWVIQAREGFRKSIKLTMQCGSSFVSGTYLHTKDIRNLKMTAFLSDYILALTGKSHR